jgi:hypothetical protein
MSANKFSHQGWLDAERPLPGSDLDVIAALKSYADALVQRNKAAGEIKKKKVLDDDLYSEFREKLVAVGYVDALALRPKVTAEKAKKGPKKGLKKGLTAKEIKAKNVADKLQTLISDVPALLAAPGGRPSVLKSDIAEIAGSAFLSMLHEGRTKNMPPNEVLAILVSTQRFFSRCANYMGIDMVNPADTRLISQIFINDLRTSFEKLRAIYPFDGMTLYEKAPELLISSSLDKYIPASQVILRRHQMDIMDVLHANFARGLLAIYDPMLGLGKTTISVAVAHYVELMRKGPPTYRFTEFMFCCNLESVRKQVARLMYNANIKFGVAYVQVINGVESVRIVNHHSCKEKKDERIAVICNSDAAHRLLKGAEDDKYVLMFDEPTTGAEERGSILRDNVCVMANVPKRAIFASATMPPLKELQPILDLYSERHRGEVGLVRSDEIQIGCDASTLSGTQFIPHMNCKTSEELQNVLLTVDRVPFLKRMYTYRTAVELWQKLHALRINTDGMPNIPKLFEDINALSADSVRAATVKILRLICAAGDDAVERVCAMPPKDDVLQLDRLGTSHAYKCPNMTLIAADTVEFALRNYADLLADIKARVKSAHHMLEKYSKALKEYNDAAEKLIKIGDSAAYDLSNLREHSPKIDFPGFAQINTSAHCAKYGGQKISFRSPLDLESIDLGSMGVFDDLKLLLCAGIGVYDVGLNSAYLDVVLALASTGALAALVAGSQISYGTNYPFGKVIIPDEFADHSPYTMFQLMGRAGRVGRAWKAEVVMSDKVAGDIMEFVKNPDKPNIEAANIIEVFADLNK